MLELNINGKKMSISDSGETELNDKMAKEIQDKYIQSDEAILDERTTPAFVIKD